MTLHFLPSLTSPQVAVYLLPNSTKAVHDITGPSRGEVELSSTTVQTLKTWAAQPAESDP